MHTLKIRGNLTKIHGRGFTLIETLLYLTLLSFILTGFLTSAYPLMTGADRLSFGVLAESEAAFVMRKIGSSLLMAPISSINVDTAGTLLINRVGGASVAIRQGIVLPNSIELSENGGAFVPLTASRTPFSNFTVTYIAPVVNEAPHEVTVSFDGGGKTYAKIYHVFY